MNEQAIEHLEFKLSEDKDFNISDSISLGFDIWKKDIGHFILFGFTYLFLSIAVGNLPQIVQIINNLIVSPCISLGAVIFAYRVHTKEERAGSNLFDGFAHWLKIFQYSSILMVLVLIALAPILYYIMNHIDPSTPAALLESWAELSLTSAQKVLCIFSAIMAILLSVCFGFAPLFIGFYELDPITALKYSYQFVLKNLWPILVFVLAGVLIAFSGVLLLGFGVFISFSLAFTLQYAAFEELTAVTEYFRDDETPDSVDEMF